MCVFFLVKLWKHHFTYSVDSTKKIWSILSHGLVWRIIYFIHSTNTFVTLFLFTEWAVTFVPPRWSLSLLYHASLHVYHPYILVYCFMIAKWLIVCLLWWHITQYTTLLSNMIRIGQMVKIIIFSYIYLFSITYQSQNERNLTCKFSVTKTICERINW